MLTESLQDLHYVFRQLRFRPGFTATVLLMLLLGFGASAAIFAFVDAALLKPLPFRDPQRLVWTTELVERMGPANLSWQDYQDWKGGARSFQSFAVWRHAGFLLGSGEATRPVPAMRVSANFLHTLSLAPKLGRDFQDSDNLASAANVAMLTDATWQQLGGRKDIVGQSIRLDGEPVVVIGVLPRDFQFAPRGALALLTAIRPIAGECEGRRSCHSLNGVARLNDGVTIAAADAEVKGIARRLETMYPSSNRGQGAVVLPLADQVVGKIRPLLWTLLGGAVLLYVIGCLNVASLLLARSDARGREFAIRGALGATRFRLLRQFAVESLLVVGLGVVAGLWAASSAMRLILALIPAEMRSTMPFLAEVHLGLHTVCFTGAEALLAAAAFAAVPMLRLSLQRLRSALVSGTSGSGSLSWRRTGSQIVVAEVAIAVVLLVCAGLLSRSLFRLLRIDLAFEPEHLLTLSLGTPDAPYKTDAEKLQVQQAVAERLRRVPGVTGVAFGDQLPVTYNGNTNWIRLVGKPYDGHHDEVNERSASPSYFSVLGARVIRGRVFTDADTQGKQKVVIINRKLAEMYFPGEDPMGKQFGDTELSPASIEQIVGVVDDLHEGALEDEMWPAEYEPAYQNVDGRAMYAVRVAGADQGVLPELVAAVREVSPDLGVSDAMTMDARIHDSQSATVHRGAAWMAGAFSCAALLLCGFGLYGVVMYSVSLRTREMGVRLALGSPRRAIYELVLRESTVLSTVGLVLGLLMAVGTAVALRSLLFQVSAWDGATLAVVAVVVMGCSLLAGWMPARRAAMLDPVESLRTE